MMPHRLLTDIAPFSARQLTPSRSDSAIAAASHRPMPLHFADRLSLFRYTFRHHADAVVFFFVFPPDEERRAFSLTPVQRLRQRSAAESFADACLLSYFAVALSFFQLMLPIHYAPWRAADCARSMCAAKCAKERGAVRGEPRTHAAARPSRH